MNFHQGVTLCKLQKVELNTNYVTNLCEVKLQINLKQLDSLGPFSNVSLSIVKSSLHVVLFLQQREPLRTAYRKPATAGILCLKHHATGVGN